MQSFCGNGRSVRACLDNPEFFFHEHNLKIGGKYFNFFTCLRDMGTCPLCESGDNPSYCVAATIINHNKYEDSKGNVHQNQKQLFVARGKARGKIVRQIEKREDLSLSVFEFYRDNQQNTSSVGEEIEFLGKLTKDKLASLQPDDAPDDWTEPFDYETIFEPKSEEELRKLVGLKAPIGSDEEERKTSKKKSVEEEEEAPPKKKKPAEAEEDAPPAKKGKAVTIDDLF